MKSMIIRSGEINVHHVCPSCITPIKDEVIDPNEIITHFYSERHARDSGWRATKDINFCDPKKSYVWVCPDCWVGFNR